ncbi:MAG TPA: PIG-L family deacetylase [Polyangia bacterium]|nr:PIG-L family deacetylase [Polyangia bacterium]
MSSERKAAFRAFLRAANGLAAARVEDVWAWSCARVRDVAPAAASCWSSSGRERVVVIAPHADDEIIGCAGTVIRHVQAGDRTRIVVATDGRRSGAYGFDPAAMAERRREEAAEAARRLGADLDWLGLPEGDWADQTGAAMLARVLSELSPTVVYAPSAIDYHPEHRRVAAALASIVPALPQPLEVRVYAIQVPLTRLLVNLVHDVSDLADPIGRAAAAYATQRQTIAYTLRLNRYAARCYGAGTMAEAFCRVPGPLYAALHARPPATFRAIYPRAWTDPLAALRGWRERAAWRRYMLRQQ